MQNKSEHKPKPEIQGNKEILDVETTRRKNNVTVRQILEEAPEFAQIIKYAKKARELKRMADSWYE